MPRLVNRIVESFEWRAGIRILRVVQRDMTLSVPPGADVVETRALDRDEVMSMAEDPALDLRSEWAREALELPGGCAAAFRDGRPVAYCWFAYSVAPERDGLWVQVPPGVALQYKTFVRREYRGMGIAQRLYRFIDRLCVEPGRETAVSLIALHNAPSLAASESIGARGVGYVVTWSAFGRHLLVLHSPGAKRLGLRVMRGKPVAAMR